MEIIAGDAPFICRCLWSVEIKNNPWNATFKETHGTRHSLLQSKALLSLHPETAVCRIEWFVEAAYIVIFLCRYKKCNAWLKTFKRGKKLTVSACFI
jgi:hypothetical protein